MTHRETVKDLLKIVDRLIDLLMVQSAAEVLDDESPTEEFTDAIAGYVVTTTPWTVEDEVVRDPLPPDTDDPVDDE